MKDSACSRLPLPPQDTKNNINLCKRQTVGSTVSPGVFLSLVWTQLRSVQKVDTQCRPAVEQAACVWESRRWCLQPVNISRWTPTTVRTSDTLSPVMFFCVPRCCCCCNYWLPVFRWSLPAVDVSAPPSPTVPSGPGPPASAARTSPCPTLFLFLPEHDTVKY